MDRRFKSNTWCTGEDSNLRSSQGAADLQSAAINHSATCAEAGSSSFPNHCSGAAGASRHEGECLRDEKESRRCEHTSAPGSLHFGKFLMECVLGNPAVPPPTCCACPAFSGNYSGAGEGI